MIPQEISNVLEKEFGISPQLTGSRFICEKPNESSDWDYLLKVDPIQSEIGSLVSYLANEGFAFDGGEHYQISIKNAFMSFRKDKLNFLVSSDADWCAKHQIATRLCKKLKLDKKEDRIAVFQALLYGNVFEG